MTYGIFKAQAEVTTLPYNAKNVIGADKSVNNHTNSPIEIFDNKERAVERLKNNFCFKTLYSKRQNCYATWYGCDIYFVAECICRNADEDKDNYLDNYFSGKIVYVNEFMYNLLNIKKIYKVTLVKSSNSNAGIVRYCIFNRSSEYENKWKCHYESSVSQPDFCTVCGKNHSNNNCFVENDTLTTVNIACIIDINCHSNIKWKDNHIIIY